MSTSLIKRPLRKTPHDASSAKPRAARHRSGKPVNSIALPEKPQPPVPRGNRLSRTWSRLSMFGSFVKMRLAADLIAIAGRKERARIRRRLQELRLDERLLLKQMTSEIHRIRNQQDTRALNGRGEQQPLIREGSRR